MSAASLTSLTDGYRALVFGASGGIGAAFVDFLRSDPRCSVVYAASRQQTGASQTGAAGKMHRLGFDLEDEPGIANAVAQASADGPLDLVLVATGLLHDGAFQPEKTLRALAPVALERAFRVNAIGPALIGKHALRHMPRDRKAVFAALSARVGSISDNRLGGWHSYRASKAALNMLVRNLAIEMAMRHPQAVCVTLHPGTVATRLSQPFQESVAPGKLFTAQRSASALMAVIDALAPSQSGRLFAWDGKEIPF